MTCFTFSMTLHPLMKTFRVIEVTSQYDYFGIKLLTCTAPLKSSSEFLILAQLNHLAKSSGAASLTLLLPQVTHCQLASAHLTCMLRNDALCDFVLVLFITTTT